MDKTFSLAVEMDDRSLVVFSATAVGYQIFYPADIEVPSDLIQKTLSMVSRDTMIGKDEWGEFYSANRFPYQKKRAIKDSAGNITYKNLAFPDGCGRVWVKIDNALDDGYIFTLIVGKNGNSLAQFLCGNEKTNVIKTFESNLHSEYALDAPRADKEVISLYADNFLNLFLKIASLSGKRKPKFLHFDAYGLLTSAILQKKKFSTELFRDSSSTLTLGHHKNGVDTAIKVVQFNMEFNMCNYEDPKLSKVALDLFNDMQNYVSETFLRIPLNNLLPSLESLKDFLKKLYSQLDSKKPIPTFK